MIYTAPPEKISIKRKFINNASDNMNSRHVDKNVQYKKVYFRNLKESDILHFLLSVQ